MLKMLNPLQWILAIVDAIARLSIEAKKEAQNHVKTAQIEPQKQGQPSVWRSVPRPDV